MVPLAGTAQPLVRMPEVWRLRFYGQFGLAAPCKVLRRKRLKARRESRRYRFRE